MERIVFLLFLCAAVEGDVGKHCFVTNKMKWLDAQTHCRKHHTDLSSVSTQSGVDRLLEAGGASPDPKGWIGLSRDPSNNTVWKWSGGTDITYRNWADRQPDNHKNKEFRGEVLANGKWNDENEDTHLSFYCISVIVVEQKKSWEEALEYCREHHKDLSSLHSETDSILAQTAFQKVNTTEQVWIGLRYLEDRWLWVSESPLSQLQYEAWNHQGDQDHQCPIWKRCGALTRGGLWQNWDCHDKLNFICQ